MYDYDRFAYNVRTCSFALGDPADELHETSTPEEFGDEQSGIALWFGGFDPLQAWAQNAAFATAFAQHSASIAAHIVVDQ
jgi:hypothetical protein